MATKAEIITFITENSEEFSVEDLEKLLKGDLEEIADAIVMETEDNGEIEVDEDEDDLVEALKSNDELKLVSSENYGDDGVALSDEQIDQLIFEDDEDGDEYIVEEVEEEWDYDKLCPNDQRLYRRTGIKKITKTIKYTRFDKEEPKI